MYQVLYDAWKKELERKQIQRLPKNFYREILSYFKKLDEISMQGDPIKRELAILELKYAKKMLRDLFLARIKKIQEAVARDSNIEFLLPNLTEEERNFARNLKEAYNQHIENLNRLLSLQPLEYPKKMVIMITRNIENSFVGVDLKVYGPYKRGDIVSIPTENALALIEKGLARKVEVKE